MIKSMGLLVVSVLCLGACDIEHYDDCNSDGFDYDDEFENGSPRAGTSSRAGASGSEAGSTSSGGASSSGGSTSEGGTTSAGGSASGSAGTGEGGSPEPIEPPATPCERERDCEPLFNCNADSHECEPADAETCGELELEAECGERTDCIPVYGGIDCSCGQDCECQGGEPGCICQSFEFVVCRAAE